MLYSPIKPANLSIVVAVSQNYAIGRHNDLIWHISDDLKHFKALTSNHTVVMGRRTFDSLPKKPLPNRRNIILTHDSDFSSQGIEVAHSLNEVFNLTAEEDEVFVIGGANIYQQFLPFVSRLYVTWIYSEFEADAFFPVIDQSRFRLVSQTDKTLDTASGLLYNYADYVAIPASPNCLN